MKTLKDIMILVFAATLIISVTAYAADSLPEDAELTQVAEEGLYAFLEIIPQIQQEDGEFGFAETDSNEEGSASGRKEEKR